MSDEAAENSSSQDADDPVEALRVQLVAEEQALMDRLRRVREQLGKIRGASPKVSYGNCTQAVYEVVREHPGCSSALVRQYTGLSRDTVLHTLRDLTHRGMLRREGPRMHYRHFAIENSSSQEGAR